MSRRLRQRIARRRTQKRLRCATYPRWFASSPVNARPPLTLALLHAIKASVYLSKWESP